MTLISCYFLSDVYPITIAHSADCPHTQTHGRLAADVIRDSRQTKQVQCI